MSLIFFTKSICFISLRNGYIIPMNITEKCCNFESDPKGCGKPSLSVIKRDLANAMFLEKD